MYRRNIDQALQTALTDTPVVLLMGARQTGKTTLAQRLVGDEGDDKESRAAGSGEGRPLSYLSFDEPGLLAEAKEDPQGFLAGLDEPVVLDEVQRVPELFLPLKATVDRRREPGRFLLTGSANIMVLPQLSQALVGRMELFTLWPLSQGELLGVKEGFLDGLFGHGPMAGPAEPMERDTILNRLIMGGYPEVVKREDPQRRQDWYESYLSTLLVREVQELSQIDKAIQLPRLLRLLAARTGSLLNASELSRSFSLPYTTLNRYLALLQATFVYQPLAAWSANLGKRLVKAPKAYLNDTGLAAYLMGVESERSARQSMLLGPLLENFVFCELLKQKGWSRVRPEFYHYRTRKGLEVDLVLEDRQGRVVGLEVKSAATFGSNDLKGLKDMATALGERFHRGVLLYMGTERLPLGPKIEAVPISALWQSNLQNE